MKALIFDLFDTLVSSGPPGGPSQQDIAGRLRVSVDDLRLWWHESSRRRMTGEFADYVTCLRTMRRDLRSQATDAELEAVASRRYQRKRGVLLRVEKRIMHMIAALEASGARVGVLSNTTEDEIAAWDECPLSTMLEDAVFSCHVGAVKPELAIYTVALERLQLEASDCVFVGDGGSDELRGAALSGMIPIQAKWYVDRTVSWDLSQELLAASRPEEVPALIANLGRSTVT